MNHDSAKNLEPLYFYDPSIHAIIGRRNVTIVQEHKYFSTIPDHRPDLANVEYKDWMSKYVFADRLKQNMGHFVTRQIEIASFLTSGNAYRTLEQTKLFRLDKTFANNFNPMLSPKEIDSAVNWFDKIISRVNKYEIVYPNSDVTELHNQGFKDVSTIQERQDKVRDTMLKEMGVDFSIFGEKSGVNAF